MKWQPRAAALVFAATLLGCVADPAAAHADSAHAQILVTGSSWAALAVQPWQTDVQAQGMIVDYTASGSAQGRKDFANQTNDLAISDVPYQGEDPTTHTPDNALGRPVAYLPVVAGGTAFPYHIQVGNQMVRNLRLSGKTLAKIFTNQITDWSDPEITADNNNVALPPLPIIPVVHSEGAGTTAMFTKYLATQFPSIWAPCNGGIDAETEYFPLNCGKNGGPQKAQSGSDGVMAFITNKNANGSIGIEEYSYALGVDYPVVKLLNSAGYYTLPTQYNVAVALTKAVFNLNANDQNYLTADLGQVYVNPDPRTYPLSSYVYSLLPMGRSTKETPPGVDQRMTTGKRQTIVDFLTYSICQGQREIGPIGYSSLPINLVQASFTQINKLHDVDGGVNVEGHDATKCGNPTFDPNDLSKNLLAEEAPQPPACDKIGVGPCAAGVGSYNGAVSGAAAANKAAQQVAASAKGGKKAAAANAAAGAGTGGGAAASQSGAAGADGSSTPDAASGTDTSGGSDVSSADPVAVSKTLAAADPESTTTTLIVLTVVFLVLLVVGPSLYARHLTLRRRPESGSL